MTQHPITSNGKVVAAASVWSSHRATVSFSLGGDMTALEGAERRITMNSGPISSKAAAACEG